MIFNRLLRHSLGCLSVCLWRWSEDNTDSIDNKNMWTKSSASIFSYPLSWWSSSTPHIYHQWLSALWPFPICYQLSWSLFSRKLLLTSRSWKTTDQCETFPSCPKSLRKLFSASSRTICCPTIYSILISRLTMLVIAPRQPFSRWSMTFSLLSMKTKSLTCLCLVYLLPLILLTTPFFCNVFVTLLVYLTLSLLGSLPISLIAPKLSL